MTAPMSTEKIRTFLRFYRSEPTIKAAAAKAGVSERWATNYLRELGKPEAHRRELGKAMAKVEGLGRPLFREEMKPEARDALDDFALFRRRYFGRATLPWQTEMVAEFQRLGDTPHKEYAVVNVAPGGGKSTALLDAACWEIARWRGVRAAFGSAIQQNAISEVLAVRRELERIVPYTPSDIEADYGAIAAEATLAADYGLFKSPQHAEVWRADRFVVVQQDEQAIFNKEPTLMAISEEMRFIGNRFNRIWWDDLVTDETMLTMHRIDAQREWWDGTAESRLEPRGAMYLVGQRKSSIDLYRHALDKVDEPDDEDEDENEDDDEERDLGEQVPMYSHIVFRAHDESKCEGIHNRKEAKPWPEGCLLDPYRLRWRDLRKVRRNNPNRYAIEYQQEDADPHTTLVKKVWVHGGRDPETGEEHPGCYDLDRRLCQIPSGIIGQRYSICTVDPSPTKWWAIQWWLYYPSSRSALLIDLLRVKMGGDGLLDWNNATQRWTGVMEEWQERSKNLGAPIGHWIVEDNAAQKFLLQYEHVKRWQRFWRVPILPHQTTVRKLDPELGVDTLKSWYQFGNIRLPKGDEAARLASLKLVDEVTRYPNPGTDDELMANWFLTYNLPKIVRRERTEHHAPRPTLVGNLPQAHNRLRSVV